MGLRAWSVNGRPIATTFNLDDRPFHPTLKQRLGSAIVWYGMNLILGHPPKQGVITRNKKTLKLTWWRS